MSRYNIKINMFNIQNQLKEKKRGANPVFLAYTELIDSEIY